MGFTPFAQFLPTAGGTVTGNLAVNGTITAGTSPGGPVLELVASTGDAGFALQNGTPTILTWTAPADGNLHRAWIVYNGHVTVAETGGAVNASWTLPDGTGTVSPTLASGTSGVGGGQASCAAMIEPGSTITVKQTSALTVGAATAWAEIWAS